jgi:hypothetical protein
MDSTLPAMSSRTGCWRYSASSRLMCKRQSGSSRYIRISCSMIPFSFSTPAAVKCGVCTKSSSSSRLPSSASVHEKM